MLGVNQTVQPLPVKKERDFRKPEEKLCRVCAGVLPPGGHRRIGVCSMCIRDNYKKIEIPGAGYGTKS